MYKITIDNDVFYSDKVTFIKNQPNGVIISCSQEEAQGIVALDGSENLAFRNKGLDDILKVIDFEEIPLDEYLSIVNTETKQQLKLQDDAIIELAALISDLMMKGE